MLKEIYDGKNTHEQNFEDIVKLIKSSKDKIQLIQKRGTAGLGM